MRAALSRRTDCESTRYESFEQLCRDIAARIDNMAGSSSKGVPHGQKYRTATVAALKRIRKSEQHSGSSEYSFNVKGQLIVCTPETWDTFLFARLDVLVMGKYIVVPRAIIRSVECGDVTAGSGTPRKEPK
jgi:hypothetical protein